MKGLHRGGRLKVGREKKKKEGKTSFPRWKVSVAPSEQATIAGTGKKGTLKSGGYIGHQQFRIR